MYRKGTHVPFLERWVGLRLEGGVTLKRGAPKGGHVRVKGEVDRLGKGLGS